MEFEKDETKTFAYTEDNGDGTTTMYINFPEHDIYHTVLLNQPFESFIGLAEEHPEMSEALMDNMTTIPNDAEDVS